MAERIKCVVGDASVRHEDGPLVIAHITNVRGKMRRGFAKDLTDLYPNLSDEYEDWATDPNGDFYAGNVQFTEVDPDSWSAHGQLWVANMVAQQDYDQMEFRGEMRPPIRYQMLERALGLVSAHCIQFGAKVQMPFIGCGLAHGNWDKIEQ